MDGSSPSKLDGDGGQCKNLGVGNSSEGLDNTGGGGLMGVHIAR